MHIEHSIQIKKMSLNLKNTSVALVIVLSISESILVTLISHRPPYIQIRVEVEIQGLFHHVSSHIRVMKG